MSLVRIVKLFVIIILPSVVYNFTHAKNQNVYNTDRSKRFTLQDLFSGGHAATDTEASPTNNGNTQTVDVQSLLNAIQANQNKPVQNFHRPNDIDLEPDKNGNYNVPELSSLLNRGTVETPQTAEQKHATNPIDFNNLASSSPKSEQQNVVKEELTLGKEKLELEAAGKRATHYTLVKGADGAFNLVPVVDGAAQTGSNRFEVLQPKTGTEENGRSRQQMQLTTLSQALYSPFPSDQNTLHLHLKGKDGKDGKAGNKGPMGTMGPRGSAGPQGSKGDPGTCSAQVNGLFECTPDMLDTLSNRIDYLEKICQKKAPPPPFKPIGVAGTEGNPLPSCQAVYEKDPNSRSGPYWLMVNGVKFKTWCRFIKGGGDTGDDRPPLAGGWTLVARVKGQSTDWSPVSDLWSNDETLNEATGADKKATVSMKNVGWNLIKSNVLLLCFSGHDSHCAPMTHGKDTNLRKLFQNNYGVVVEEQYTMATFLKAIGKSCDLSKQRLTWCGLNLGDVCNAKKANPNEKPPKTTHIVRIGCIGDATPTCFPDDYAIGVGVTSCKDGFGCSNVGQSKNLHYRCDYVFGAFSQTAYIFVL